MINHENFIGICINKVVEFENSRVDNIEETTERDVFIVWTCKTLQNHKAILSTKHKGAYMYEFTLNGDKEVIYRDTYEKINNTEITNIDLK